ncbi:hypothetical protein C4572_03945 [Candidatus Parcubacteria bacterium]|nr:MAG: hypothetical protein C4572_03945 [Candidatus Parcubacteria bacterium]
MGRLIEIKLRKKGEVITVSGFPERSIPEIIRPTGDEFGVDLTAYAVIYAEFGRFGRDKAAELQGRAPSAIIVYKYEWHNGWGEGVLLPENFNLNQVRFYKTSAQKEEEEEDERSRAAEALRLGILGAIPNVHVHMVHGHAGDVVKAEIGPRQEAFSLSEGWHVYATSIAEAQASVEKKIGTWQEWNERAIKVFVRHSGRNHEGGIEIRPSPTNSDNVEVCCDYNTRKWVFLEKIDGNWVECCN